MTKIDRKVLRKSKIAARDALGAEERELRSRRIVENLIISKEYRESEVIMIYRGIRGEVRLEALEEVAKADGKKLAYPLCISDSEMIALCPLGEESWKSGYCGILEPVMECSEQVAPWDIDLIVCPCTVFDEGGSRMGMGAGFYDRFLEKCPSAHVVSVAFEVQKADFVPMEPWDKPMEKVFTEEAVYGKQ